MKLKFPMMPEKEQPEISFKKLTILLLCYTKRTLNFLMLLSLKYTYSLRKQLALLRGAWVARSVKRQTLSIGTGRDL